MSKQLSKEEIQEKVENIEVIYQEYLAKLQDLENKRDQIVKEFIQELEKNKIEDVKNRLSKI